LQFDAIIIFNAVPQTKTLRSQWKTRKTSHCIFWTWSLLWLYLITVICYITFQ